MGKSKRNCRRTEDEVLIHEKAVKRNRKLIRKNIWNRKRNYASISFNITRSKFDSKNN